MASRFQRSAQRLVKHHGGGHIVTLRPYRGSGWDGAAFSVQYAIGSYEHDERDGVAFGTQKLMIAAADLPAGVDLKAQRFTITDATGAAEAFQSVRLAEFDVHHGGGEPTLYTVPLRRGG